MAGCRGFRFWIRQLFRRISMRYLNLLALLILVVGIAVFVAQAQEANLKEYDADLSAEIAECDELIADNPRDSQTYDRRGNAYFRLGQIAESISDFDKAIELRPEIERSHWRRGIAYYYAGEWAAGRKQFESYQTFDGNDVENAVWRYLCMARDEDIGVDKAREEILKVGDDRRVPMRQIYELYAGRATSDDVMAAVEAGSPSKNELNSRRFYAHLYLGLYHEVAGDHDQALHHIEKAANDYRINHYSWDVARVHAERLRTNSTKPATADP
jgi:lipoprotein NlpI